MAFPLGGGVKQRAGGTVRQVDYMEPHVSTVPTGTASYAWEPSSVV